MVRHHDVVQHEVTLAVEMPQAIGNDLCQLGPTQLARAAARIQRIVPAVPMRVQTVIYQPGVELF